MSLAVGDRVQVDSDLDELHHMREDPVRGTVMVGVATMKGTVVEISPADKYPIGVQLDGDSPNEMWSFKEVDLRRLGDDK